MSLLGKLCKRFRSKIEHAYFEKGKAWAWEYDAFLPHIATMPAGVFWRMAVLRARFKACLQVHWKVYLPFGADTYGQRLQYACNQLARLTGQDPTGVCYAHNHSMMLEEAFVERLPYFKASDFEWCGDVSALQDDRPTLWVFPHMDITPALFAPIAERRQRILFSIATEATVSDRLPAPVSRFHYRRNRHFEQYCHGGKVLLAERHQREILAVIQRRQDLYVAMDMPGRRVRDKNLTLNLFGQRRAVALGVLPHIQKQGYIIRTFYAFHRQPSIAELHIGKAIASEDLDGLQAEFDKISKHIEADPAHWYLLEHLPAYPIVP